MLEFHRLAAATVTMLLLCAASIWASVVAQDVFDSSSVVEPPQQADTKVVEKIQQALRDDSDVEATGDPILDDVLQIIKQQGSVLDGSSLDQPEEDAAPDTESDKALAAERLLKAARCLEDIKPLDETRRHLVKQMRRETVRLLSE